MWVLILTIWVSGNVVTVETMSMQSREACEKAGKTWQSKQGKAWKAVTANYACVETAIYRGHE